VTIVSLACVLLLALLSVRAERPARLDDQRLWTVVLARSRHRLLLERSASTLQFGQINCCWRRSSLPTSFPGGESCRRAC